MVKSGLLPVESMSHFILSRRVSESASGYAIIQGLPMRDELQLAGDALAILDEMEVREGSSQQNLRSRVWASACALVSAASGGELGSQPGLAGLLLSESSLPAEDDGLTPAVLKQLARLSDAESGFLKQSKNSS